MALDPAVWGPYYWFVLHTIALTYPHNPNETIKKKYYDFIQNLPLFLPISTIGNKFSELLDKYPVTPYLDSQQSFTKWMHFIHNKINEKLEKPQISLSEFFVQYYNQYKSQNEKFLEYYKLKEKIIYGGILITISGVIYYLYDK